MNVNKNTVHLVTESLKLQYNAARTDSMNEKPAFLGVSSIFININKRVGLIVTVTKLSNTNSQNLH